MSKDTGCPECDKQKGTELCPTHRLEMIFARLDYWVTQAEETINEIKNKNKKGQEHEKL